jgi:hypothetical protein
MGEVYNPQLYCKFDSYISASDEYPCIPVFYTFKPFGF